MANQERVLAVNPGSTSTKIACFDGATRIMERNLTHGADELAAFEEINDQLDVRRRAVLDALARANIELASLSATVGRGGLIHPVHGGTYRVNEAMIADLRHGVLGAHASNLGGILADEIAREAGNIPSFIVDPVVVDELEDVARPSGIPGLDRTSIFHALNQKAVARRAARELDTTYDAVSLVVAHMGGGITVGSHKNGRVIDVNDGLNGDGPFTPERSGGIAALKLVDLCFSGRYDKGTVKKMIKGQGGLVAYLGTNDAREIAKRIAAGDPVAERIYRAMAWQVGREIGAAAAALGARPDAIVLTGGLAHDDMLVSWITEGVAWIAPVLVYPGENEMIALAEGALRVLAGEEEAYEYTGASADTSRHASFRGGRV
ncbi:MAG: butyrate kinase [Spirochaetales bacterium]|nr:butyrate kinase [Spirochaetales bacterium]